LRRVQRPYEYEISHDGRPPVLIRIPDLEVVACINPDCHPDDPGETEILDDAALRRIGDETSRQLGLLTPAEIRENRERLGLNQQELQELLGLGGNSLSRWENGRVYQSRSMDTLLRLVFNSRDALDVLRSLPRERCAPAMASS
jgi:putative zinc finger/helix-turn-helix YgiT family protein